METKKIQEEINKEIKALELKILQQIVSYKGIFSRLQALRKKFARKYPGHDMLIEIYTYTDMTESTKYLYGIKVTGEKESPQVAIDK